MRAKMWIAIAAYAMTATWTGMAVAKDAPQPAPGTQRTQQGTQASSDTEHLTPAELIFESSHLTKLDVFNHDNTKLGQIDNLIIDAHDGLVQYGILDTGVTGKNVIVPWNALRLAKDSNDKYFAMLNVSKDKLANAPTFDRDHWPNFTGDDFRGRVNDFFGVRTVARPTDTETKDVPQEEREGRKQLSRAEMIFESSHLSDLNVFNNENVKLGQIDDLIIDAHRGTVLYGIVDTGVAGKRVIVPWNGLRLAKDQDNKFFAMLNVSKDKLANAPTFDRDRWPNFTSQDFQRQIDQYFGVRTAARPTQPESK